jgi:pilus assembly protein CpaB
MSWTTRLKNRQLGLGVAAAVAGVLSFWLAHRYLRGQELAARQRVAAQFQTRDVVVAAAHIAVGTVLDPAMLAKRAVPERFIASDAYAPELVGQVAGRRVLRALRSGEPLTASVVESASTPSLSSLIEPGLRAITIPVDESSAAAGLLAPGDLVDLLLVTRDANSSTGDAAVRPLLQAVHVVATGRQTRRAKPAQGSDAVSVAVDGGETESSFATLTLHVRPEDAERILLGERIGELSVLLRTRADTEAGVVPTLDSRALLGGTNHRSVRARSHGMAIEYIIGGGSGATGLHRANAQLALGGRP